MSKTNRVLGCEVNADRAMRSSRRVRTSPGRLLGKAFDDLSKVVKRVADTPRDPYSLPFSRMRITVVHEIDKPDSKLIQGVSAFGR